MQRVDYFATGNPSAIEVSVDPARDVGLGLCAIDCACYSVPLQEGLNWIVITSTVTGKQPGQLHVPVDYSPAVK